MRPYFLYSSRLFYFIEASRVAHVRHGIVRAEETFGGAHDSVDGGCRCVATSRLVIVNWSSFKKENHSLYVQKNIHSIDLKFILLIK